MGRSSLERSILSTEVRILSMVKLNRTVRELVIEGLRTFSMEGTTWSTSFSGSLALVGDGAPSPCSAAPCRHGLQPRLRGGRTLCINRIEQGREHGCWEGLLELAFQVRRPSW